MYSNKDFLLILRVLQLLLQYVANFDKKCYVFFVSSIMNCCRVLVTVHNDKVQEIWQVYEPIFRILISIGLQRNLQYLSRLKLPWRVLVHLTLTLIQTVSNWTHWDTLRCHPCLSRAATSASFQVNPIFRRSLLTTPLQFALGRPGPLLYPGTCQYSACCGMRWWSIRKTCPAKSSFSQYVVHGLLSSSGSDLHVH